MPPGSVTRSATRQYSQINYQSINKIEIPNKYNGNTAYYSILNKGKIKNKDMLKRGEEERGQSKNKVKIMKIKKCQITSTNLKEIVNPTKAKCRKTGRRNKGGERGEKSNRRNE